MVVCADIDRAGIRRTLIVRAIAVRRTPHVDVKRRSYDDRTRAGHSYTLPWGRDVCDTSVVLFVNSSFERYAMACNNVTVRRGKGGFSPQLWLANAS